MRARRSMLVGLILLFALPASALPKFAARMGATCKSCHVNPTGGGLRTVFGATSYAVEDLPVPSWQEAYGLEGFSPQLNDFISVGADVRTLYFSAQSTPSDRNSFFQMQTDLYIAAHLAKNTHLYFNKGIGSRFEAFAIAGVLPLNGYVKAGWFTPAYGLRLDDHNIFVRSKTLFFGNGGQDAGLEVSISPGFLTLTGAVSNGTPSDRDDNRSKAILGRAESGFKIAPFNIRLGANYYNNAFVSGITTLYGGFLTASLSGNLTLLAEVDQMKDYVGPTNTVTTGMVSSVEIDYVLTQGLDLKLGYDFYDPNIKRKTGSESRYVVGFELYPLSGIELRPLYVINKENPVDLRNNQILFLLHFFF